MSMISTKTPYSNSTSLKKMVMNTLLNKVCPALLLTCALLLCTDRLLGQDAHFSQYDASPSVTNPALTGMFDQAEFRMATNFRSQWGTLGSSFLTTALAYDMPYEERYGFGAHFINYDQGGVINAFTFGMSGAYNIVDPSADYMLTTGMQLGFVYKKINDADLLFDNQYGDGYFDSTLPSGEDFEKGGRIMPDVSLGVGYKSTDQRKIINPFANLAVYHVTTPDENILSSTRSEMPIRWSVNGGTLIELSEEFFLRPNASYQRQGSDQEVLFGVMSEYELDGTVFNLIGGLAHRLNDSGIIHLGLKHGFNMYRFSYDFNTSGLKEFTGRTGALEFSIVYYGTHDGRSTKRKNGARF